MLIEHVGAQQNINPEEISNYDNLSNSENENSNPGSKTSPESKDTDRKIPHRIIKQFLLLSANQVKLLHRPLKNPC